MVDGLAESLRTLGVIGPTMSFISDQDEREATVLSLRQASQRLRSLGLVMIGIIAMLIIATQVGLLVMLAWGESDSKVINVAGRQRMLSQRIVANAAVASNLHLSGAHAEAREHLVVLEDATTKIAESHRALGERDPDAGLGGTNTATIAERYRELDRDLSEMLAGVADLRVAIDAGADETVLTASLRRIDAGANRFLPVMHETVGLHESDAVRKRTTIKSIFAAISTLQLAVLGALSVATLLPAARMVRRTIDEVEEAMLRRREITTALDLSNDGVFMFDADTLEFVYANKGATEQIGYSQEELGSMTPLDLKPSFTPRSFAQMLHPLRERPGESVIFRTEHQHRDGRRIPVEISLQLIPDLGMSGRFIASVRDITAQLEMDRSLMDAKEEAEAANRSKSEFLANMSHEIRTPMTAILGYSDLLYVDGDITEAPERRRDTIRTIRQNGEHLLTIINDILDVSKIEAGQLSVELIETDPVRVVSEAASLLKARADEKGIGLNVRYDTPIPKRIESDPTRLLQIVLNLAGNAVKFTDHGAVTIRVSCDPDDWSIAFRVEDTGIGMTPEQRDDIARFEAFTQADASTTRKFGGTGLGLRISNALATMLGGGIDIESTRGEGSAFTATVSTGDLGGVPMIRPEDGIRAREEIETPVDELTATPLEGVRVLLAEDGPDNQKLISHFLTKAGAEVCICGNGRIAAETIEGAGPDQLPDVVLMDMQMPELDGYSATRRLRDAGFTVPVIALTANAMDGDRDRCLEAGCDDYASKPVNRIELIETCRRWAAGEGSSARAA